MPQGYFFSLVTGNSPFFPSASDIGPHGGSRRGGGGDSDVACQILNMTMSHVIVSKKIALSHVTNNSKPNVACQI